MSQSMKLDELPTDILLIVFSQLSVSDLIQLQKTCRRFCSIIQHFWDILIYNRRLQFLVTNQSDESFQKRCRKEHSSHEKHRISINWREGQYFDSRTVLSGRCIPDFHVERDSIWLGTNSSVSCFEKKGNKIITNSPKYTLTGVDFSKTCKFRVNNECVSVVNGKKLQLWFPQNGGNESKAMSLGVEATSIDMESDLIGVGSKEGWVKLYLNSDDLNEVSKLRFKDSICTLALNRDRIAIGTAASNARVCIGIADTITGERLQTFQGGLCGGGVLQVKWENPNIIWAGGYDTYLKRYDLRTRQCVQKFLDPWGSKINCFDWDSVNTAITGCDRSRATLWDLRNDKEYVQMYTVESSSKRPIRCIAFDSENLYAATENVLNILDFSGGLLGNLGSTMLPHCNNNSASLSRSVLEKMLLKPMQPSTDGRIVFWARCKGGHYVSLTK